jgi:AraC-like DNA-binding protein
MEEIRLQPGQEWMDGAVLWRFLRLTGGAAYWLGDPRSRALVEGELLVIPPGAKGVVRASQLNEVVLHGFGFDPDSLCGLFTLGDRHSFQNGGGKPWEVRFLPSTHPAAQRFAALAAGAAKNGELALRAEALLIVAEVLDDEMAQLHPHSSPNSAARHRFEEFIAQMPDSEIIHQTVAGLARLCGCSPRHFNRLFRRRFGDSIRARQTELRLINARQLLGTTDARISEIALASGYRNVSLFNSLFKRRFGMTPSEWRRQIRNEGPGSVTRIKAD